MKRALIAAVAAGLAAGCWNFDTALQACLDPAGVCLPAGQGMPDASSPPDAGTAVWQVAHEIDTTVTSTGDWVTAVHAVSPREAWFATYQSLIIQSFDGTFTENRVAPVLAITHDSTDVHLAGGESGLGRVYKMPKGQAWDGGDLNRLQDQSSELQAVWMAGDQLWGAQFLDPLTRLPAGPVLQLPNGEVDAIKGWGSAQDDFWVVARPTEFTRELLHYQGAWTTQHAENALNAVYGMTPDDVWAVGDDGMILRFHGDGGSAQLDAGVKVSWVSVWGSGPNDVFLAGYSTAPGGRGVVSHWDGTTFKAQPFPYTMSKLSGTGPEDVWAADFDAGIWHFSPPVP